MYLLMLHMCVKLHVQVHVPCLKSNPIYFHQFPLPPSPFPPTGDMHIYIYIWPTSS